MLSVEKFRRYQYKTGVEEMIERRGSLPARTKVKSEKHLRDGCTGLG